MICSNESRQTKRGGDEEKRKKEEKKRFVLHGEAFIEFDLLVQLNEWT